MKSAFWKADWFVGLIIAIALFGRGMGIRLALAHED